MPGTTDLDQHDPVAGTIGDRCPTLPAREFLSDPLGPGLTAAVGAACRDTGFFCIALDDERQRVVDGTLAVTEAFFGLGDSDPRKTSVRQHEGGRGWVPRYAEPAYQPDTVATLEAFDFGTEEAARYGDRQSWPAVPGFGPAAAACWRAFLQLADGVLETIGHAAGLAPGFLKAACSSRQLNTMRLLHYGPVPPAPADNLVGIAAHTDFECITLLYQTGPGLELLARGGHWVDAPVGDGRVVVLLDDMLERWTNGSLQATGHRVRNTGKRRYSIVLFVAANDEIVVEPLEAFISAAVPARYPPVTQAAHIDAEVARSRNNARRAAKSG